MSELVGVKEISRQTGMSLATVRKWIELEGIKPAHVSPGGFKDYDPSCIPIILSHKTEHASTLPNIDPESGLTWQQKLNKEKSIQIALENRRQEGLDKKELMLVSEYHQALGQIASKLEKIPGKAQSELGLSGAQVAGLRRMLDEAREASAEEMEE